MLSNTYTIEDIKAALRKSYDFFDYTTNDEFESDLVLAVDDVMRIWFYPRIGKTRYDEISEKDKTGIDFDTDPYELYLYWAEVYTVCYEFNEFKTRTDNQQQSSSSESLKVEGYAYSSKENTSSSLGDRATTGFWDKALEYWKKAGFDINGLQRTCTIFGDSDDYFNIDRLIIQ